MILQLTKESLADPELAMVSLGVKGASKEAMTVVKTPSSIPFRLFCPLLVMYSDNVAV
jgi:hypothetical protein